jgi:topoisomerase-4 subunit A
MSLAQALNAWLAHQFVVLKRRSEHRLAKIDDRIELLDGFLIAYLNLDRVIAIIRGEDEPKPVLMAEFGLTDRQAEAILNMRLRSLRKLEEMEIRRERDTLAKEREGLVALLDSPGKQRARMKRDLAKLRDRYGPATALGRGGPHWSNRGRRGRSRWRR